MIEPKALTLTSPTKPLWSHQFPLKWQSQTITYLVGVQITRNPVKVYSTNLTGFMKSLNSDLVAWSKLTLSFIGRSNFIAFPKLLYPCHALPMYLRLRDKKLFNRTFCTFIWQGKHPCIVLHILQQHKLHRGVNFPDIKLYNLSANLCVIQNWFMDTSLYSPITLEGQLYPSISLPNLVHLAYSSLPAEVKCNPVFMAT